MNVPDDSLSKPFKGLSIHSLNKSESSAASVGEEVNRIISSDKDLNMDKKRELYQSAFKILQNHALECGNTLQVQRSLFEVFELYAAKTCYGQASKNDPEEGFRKSARLMELSLCMQLEALDLGGVNYEWMKFNTLEELIQSLEIQPDQGGKFFSFIAQLNMEPKVLAQKAEEKGLSPLIAKTLMRMTYSHQNISPLANPRDETARTFLYAFHRRFNDLTEELIGSENIIKQRELVGYCYNRCSFLSGLKNPHDWQAKLQSYEPIIEAIKQFYPEKDFDGNSRMAQIFNMQGLIICRSGLEPKEARKQSYPYFIKAFETRKLLVASCEEQEKCFEQKFLLSNIRTALIDDLVNRDPLSVEKKEEALAHAAELEKFLLESRSNKNFHSYHSSYSAAIEKTKKLNT